MCKLYIEPLVGTPEFRRLCVYVMIQKGILNINNFFERYLNGEDFSDGMLIHIGYNHSIARNINIYIHHQHDGFYDTILSWE